MSSLSSKKARRANSKSGDGPTGVPHDLEVELFMAVKSRIHGGEVGDEPRSGRSLSLDQLPLRIRCDNEKDFWLRQ